MKINWKVRMKNKTWLLAFLGTVAAFVYQILGLADIVPAIGEDLTDSADRHRCESARYAGNRAGSDDRRCVRQRAGVGIYLSCG